MLVAVVLATTGGVAAAEGPVYDEGPVYTPAPVAKPAKLWVGGLKRNRSNGRAVLFVRVSGPGRVFVWGRGVRRFKRYAPRARRMRMLVLPKVPLKRYLKRHGKAAIRVNVGFQPNEALPRAQERRVVLKRKKRRR